MAGLQNLLEDYRNWSGLQDWKYKKQLEQMFGGDPQLQEDFEKLSGGFGTSNLGGGLAAIVSKEGLADALRKYEQQGIDIFASVNPAQNRITLSKLVVPEEMRGQGTGTKLMRDLGRYADTEQAIIGLTPSKDFGASSLARLKDFYKNVGYVENKGRAKDYSISESMYRTPLEAAYKGVHTAPQAGYGAPLHALQEMYPDDIYGPSHLAARYYGHGEVPGMDADIIRKLQSFKDKPESLVDIYRAVPRDVFYKLGPYNVEAGDWVTPSRAYAVAHGEASLGGDYKIVRKKVPAKSLFTDANSIYEFGYDPSVLSK